MGNMISIQQVSKKFGRVQAVQALNLELKSGQFVGLIGHNGAGKSTLLRMLTGMLVPDEGRVEVCGIDVHKRPQESRRHFGAVPEVPALYEYMTGREYLEFVRDVRGGGEFQSLLESMHLANDADRLIREYSQGMRRKTALAAAMLGGAEVLVLDESLNGLDPPSASVVKQLLRRHVDDGGCVLLSTHVVETVERVADRVVMLAHGRVVADELVADLPAGGLESLFLSKLAETRDAEK